jgi:hypothetical protein
LSSVDLLRDGLDELTAGHLALTGEQQTILAAVHARQTHAVSR